MAWPGPAGFIWNHFLAKHQAAYQLHTENPEQQARPSVSFFSLGKEFTALGNSGDFPWLQGYFFKVAEPRFKARGRDKTRFTIPDGVKIQGDHLGIHGLGLVRLRRNGGNPYPDGKAGKASVIHECGTWYATVCYRVDQQPRGEPERVAALDRNCGQVAVVYSDGSREIHRPPAAQLLTTTVKRARRKLAGQQKGSNPRHRTRARLRKLHRRIRNAANTWRYRLTCHMADRAGQVILEKLNIQGMTGSAQGEGTVAAPGSNVTAKAGLNRSILATGWSEMEQMLRYTTRAVYVNGAYTSRRCCRCGQVDKASRRSQSTFHCTSCGYRHHAHLNAVQNIPVSGVGTTHGERRSRDQTSTIRETAPAHSCDSSA